MGMDSRGAWVRVQSKVECIEACERPQWDSRLHLIPDQENYKNNEEVVLSCLAGFQPSFTRIKCAREKLPTIYKNLMFGDSWVGMDSHGAWIHVQSKVECIEVLQVVPRTVEISSTSIKLNWTCRVPDVCQHMRATCRLAEPSSPPCEAEEVEGEEMLHGQEGTFTCLHLHPYTVYSVTISLPPDTILYTRLLRTDEAVPDKVEELWLDSSTGSLRWKGLPSCKGEIIGYQLNITTRSSQNGSFLEMERLWLSSSVTEHPLPEYSPDRSYVVTMQGLTAAGAGVASLWEFQTNSSVAGQPLGPWPGTAVTVVVVLSVLILLSAGILWFVLSRTCYPRKKKAVPSKVEEDLYTALQLYENSDIYCVIKNTLLAEEDAGNDAQAGEPLPKPPPVSEFSGVIQSSQ
ncbi:uncharacterized protein LOC104056585 isoform X1 [Cuculus canorus]|uniref:uncharacterized protein LOC104056585 isoform X1 n=1 Tax=Cuculus canorus TaxID=55661 RepID=UPI0023AB1D42|nr:uncharacterized protein LOC104056585 isoform X1 [Cuculus canorus]